MVFQHPAEGANCTDHLPVLGSSHLGILRACSVSLMVSNVQTARDICLAKSGTGFKEQLVKSVIKQTMEHRVYARVRREQENGSNIWMLNGRQEMDVNVQSV